MRHLLSVILMLITTSWCVGQTAKIVPQEILDRIVDNEPNPLPRYLTPAERLIPLPQRSQADLLLLSPPTGEIYTPAEYEQNEGLLISWGSYNDVLTAMTVGITTGDPGAIVYVVVSGASEQASATSTLTAAGADMDQVEFITYTTNTVWIRDYGPRFIFEDNVRAIVNHDYNRPRPLDDAFPPFLGTLWGEEVYDLPLYHGGGNFHLFSNGDAFMSSLILAENPGLSEQDVQNYFSDYLNVDLTIYTGFPSTFDSTRHIDMWMFPVTDNEIIIGEYAPSTGQPYQITEDAVADLVARGYTVYRTPGWNSGGTHYTYTNATVLNDIVFVSRFGGSYTSQDAQALSVFQTAFPDHQVIQVNCSSIIHAAGAMHCIVMHVPAYTSPIPSVKVIAPNGNEQWTVGQEYEVTWVAHDDVAVTSVDLHYSTDGGATFPHEIAVGEEDDGFFLWTIPNTPSAQCRVKVVAHDADANSGEDVSDADFTITLYGPQLIYAFPLDADPGWSIEGQWGFGEPTGSGGDHGGPDPANGHTGPNVYGYNLFGDYGSGIPEYHLTSTALDCTALDNVHLRFWRWLGVEQPTYDHAYVRVSNNGVNWSTVWENTGTVSDTSWILQDFDISGVADNQATVYLRWTMGPTDSSWQYCGWNIDDIEIWAIPPDDDCNLNEIPDYEEIIGGTTDDCNDNGVPDECEIEQGSPAPGGPFFCMVGCDPDCNVNGVPDECDIAEATSQDCNGNGVPDECDVAGGTSPDVNGNGVPDECEVVPAVEAAPPHNARKNRYVSFDPSNSGISVAFQIEITASSQFPDAVGVLGWVGQPGENDVARFVGEPFFSTDWPTVVHVADCEVVPVATYEIRATASGNTFAQPLEVSTIAEPTPKKWADVVGSFLGAQWEPPNGVVNMDDVMAAVQKFQQLPSAPPMSYVDVDDQVPNMVLNMTDIQQIVAGFKGEPYPFHNPVDCPRGD